MGSDIISIIVPVYKVEHVLDKCVQSIRQQNYENIEIILVDDGSPDNCPVMCDEYAREDSRIRVCHKANGGLGDARNVGLNMATGKYILYVDSDDYIEMYSCERLVTCLEQTNADFVVGVARVINGDSKSYYRRSAVKSGCVYSMGEFISLCIQCNEWYAPVWLCMYKRVFLTENNLVFKKNLYYEDMEILPRVYFSASKIAYLDYPFYNYVIRGDSIMTSAISEKKN